MRQRWTSRIASGISLTLLIGGAAASAGAETYSWRTEDGVYAYTDDADHVPARYRDQVRVVRLRSLQSYDRYTPQDPMAASYYEHRLAERLAYLRGVNAPPETAAAAAQPSAAAAPTHSTISVSTGGANSPRLEIPVEQAGELPIVVDPTLAKRTADPRTRRVTLVKQGDKVIAVLKGSPHVYNPALDIEDEDALELGELDE